MKLSYSIGGFKISTDNLLSSSKSPNTRELAQQEKSKFIKKVKSDFEQLIKLYCLLKGYWVTDARDHTKLSNNAIKDIKPVIKKFYHHMNLVNDGGNLTSKRKDIFLESIYFMKDIEIEKIHPLFKIYENFNKALKLRNLFRDSGFGLFIMWFILANNEYHGVILLVSAIVLLVFAFTKGRKDLKKIRKEVQDYSIEIASDI